MHNDGVNTQGFLIPKPFARSIIPSHLCLWNSLSLKPFSNAASAGKPFLVSPSRRGCWCSEHVV